MEGITNPPWVYGPKEVGEWIDATYRGKEEKIKKKENIERKKLRSSYLEGKEKFQRNGSEYSGTAKRILKRY